jgi:excisionase family DNA binding protein
MTLLHPGMAGPGPGLPVDRLFGKAELARYLGLSVSGLTKLLESNRGPAALRVGRLVRFRHDDVVAWLDAQKRAAR